MVLNSMQFVDHMCYGVIYSGKLFEAFPVVIEVFGWVFIPQGVTF